MWMTGFDAPAVSSIYLDKPMKNHTLKQTSARANRVFGEKVNGLIVDYVGVFRNMQKALAIYGSGSAGGTREGECPVQVKAFLVEKLRERIGEVEAFLQRLGEPLSALQAARDFDYIAKRDRAVEAILVSEESKKAYLGLASWVARVYKAILPDPAANEFGPKRAVIVNIAEAIKSLEPVPDISGVLDQVEGLLDESIAAGGYVIREPDEKYQGRVDLSQIDFKALEKKFASGQKRTEVEKLKAALAQKVHLLIELNRTRMDYLERLQRLIEEYNSGARNVEATFEELLKFARDLSDEERRHMQEELTEEELAIFDLLVKPAPGMTDSERKKVKKVARDLLAMLKNEKLVLDWRKKEMTRAAVRQTIEIMLDYLPEVFAKPIYVQKCDAVYQHVYDSYYGPGQNLYAYH
jgi:type I restriction enzyme R subunit